MKQKRRQRDAFSDHPRPDLPSDGHHAVLEVDVRPPNWFVHAAELVDTRQESRLRNTKKPCVYCDKPTKSLNSVCCRDHSDLPSFDPYYNVQAGRFALEEAQASPDGAAPVNGSGDPSLSTCVSSSA